MKKFKGIVACALVVCLASPQCAWATIEPDQESLTDEEIAAEEQAGNMPSDLESVLKDASTSLELLGSSDNSDAASGSDAASDSNSASESNSSNEQLSAQSLLSSSANATSRMVGFSGSNRIDTAAQEAKYAYPNGTSTVIIAGSNAWVDALSATGLSGAIDAPLLFTETNELSSETSSAISSLGASRIVLLGSTNTISSGVESAISSLSGVSKVDRVSGDNRFKTQLAVYEYGRYGYDGTDHWNHDFMLVSTGEAFPDALSASSLAFTKKAPVFLADSSGSLTEVQEEALLEDEKGFSRAVILGSSARVSEECAGWLDALTVLSSTDSNAHVERIGGANRYDTSLAIANWCVDNGYLSWDKAAITTGEKPFDALAGCAVQGKDASVMLLSSCEKRDDYMVSFMSAHTDYINSIKLLGSKSTIPGMMRIQLADALDIPFVDIPEFKVYIDAGHGYDSSNNGIWDSGACGNGYEEAYLTQELSRKVAATLRNMGIQVHLNDYGGWYKLRHADAINNDCDALLSIHFNSGGGTGTESLIHSKNASFYSSTWQSKIHPYLTGALGLRDRGKKTQQVAVLGGELPATLLEICFIDNASDMATYEARIDSVAYAIAQGVAS